MGIPIVRSWVCWILSFVLVATALAQAPTGDPLAGMAVGTSIRVETTDGRTLEGVVKSRGARDFEIHTQADQDVKLLHSDVRSVKVAKRRHHTVLWIVVGGVAVAALVIGLFFKARLDNE